MYVGIRIDRGDQCPSHFGFDYWYACKRNGSFVLWPLNTIYINEHLGKSLSVAGVVLMLNSAASVVGNLLGERF